MWRAACDVRLRYPYTRALRNGIIEMTSGPLVDSIGDSDVICTNTLREVVCPPRSSRLRTRHPSQLSRCSSNSYCSCSPASAPPSLFLQRSVLPLRFSSTRGHLWAPQTASPIGSLVFRLAKHREFSFMAPHCDITPKF